MTSDSKEAGPVRGETYRAAGVDIDAADALVEAIKPLAASTRRSGALGGIGGFGALFDVKAAGFRDPILVSSTDGVGTKLKIAIEAGRHETVGIDLVAMCVNDLVVHGAEPLFFLDYFATARLSVGEARSVVAGIAEGCRRAGCALVGGETAELPGLYAEGDYDLAGFAVGAVERGTELPRGVAVGDTVLGLASSGVHSNGYSLVRRVVARAGRRWDAPAAFAPGLTLGEALLTPTRIYVGAVLSLHRAGLLKAAAHITGGGLPGNLPRVLPAGTIARIETCWPVPPVFGWLADLGGGEAQEMLRVFNCGIGMALVVADPGEAERRLAGMGESVFRIGRIEAGSGPSRVSIELPDGWLRSSAAT